MSFKKAVKEQAKLRLALCGLPGSGKTFSALAIADSIAKLMEQALGRRGRIALIDSERGSASLYADKFDFDVCELESFSPLEYVAKIKEAELLYDIVVGDSISHAWAGKDGALDQKDKATDRDPRGNSWTAWRTVTPKHNALVDAMVGCKAHFIATMRQKMEHVQETVNGRTEIKKVGLAAVQREGIEYEFTMVGDLDLSHTLKITKTRCDGIDVGDIFERPGESFAKKLYSWLTSGAPPRPRPVMTTPQSPPEAVVTSNGSGQESAVSSPVTAQLGEVFAAYLSAISQAPDLKSLDDVATGPAKPSKGTEEHRIAVEAYSKRKAELQNGRAAS